MAKKNNPVQQLEGNFIDFLYSQRPDLEASQTRYGTGHGTVSKWWDKYGKNEMPDFSNLYDAWRNKSKVESEQTRTQVSDAYKSAQDKYSKILSDLNPRYVALEEQLAKEKEQSLGEDVALAGTEQTNLKRNIASRGLEANTGNEFYNTETTKLGGQQQFRRQGVLNTYSRKALEIATARSQDERDIVTAMAELDVKSAEAIRAMFESDRSFEESKEEFKKQFDLSEEQYQLALKQFKWSKKVDKYQMKKSSSSSSTKSSSKEE
jgi:hypothetical protein